MPAKLTYLEPGTFNPVSSWKEGIGFLTARCIVLISD